MIVISSTMIQLNQQTRATHCPNCKIEDDADDEAEIVTVKVEDDTDNEADNEADTTLDENN